MLLLSPGAREHPVAGEVGAQHVAGDAEAGGGADLVALGELEGALDQRPHDQVVESGLAVGQELVDGLVERSRALP